MRFMKSTLLFLALASIALAQPATYTAYDSGTLSTQATTLTVQHTAGSVKNATIVGVYVECASCSVQLSRSGTAATTTITADAAPIYIVWDPSLTHGSEDALLVLLAGASAPTHIYASVTERTLP